METLSFDFITNWYDSAISLLTSSAQTIILAGLVLLALVMGGFYLIGLAKKGVKSAK